MIASALDSFGYALVALLVIFDPAGTAALFTVMTPRDTPAERREQAVRACVIAFVVLATFGLAGEALLRSLGIGLPAMRVAGGILLFITAAEMVTGRGAVRETETEREAAIRTEEDISVFPLAIPLIAGPGAMTTMVLLHSSASGDAVRIGAIEAALVVAIFVQLVGLLAAPWVSRVIGPTGSNVIGRVLGVLLAALAAQITLDGLHAALHI
ncbi:MAG TPA: MarC family protein [Acidisphaera sp.]|nr:MarC family protein [Acidisphaera sp.]